MKLTNLVIVMALAIAGLAGCDSKRDEDVAAIRAHMDKKAAEEEAQKAKSKANFEAMKKNAQKSVDRQGHRSVAKT